MSEHQALTRGTVLEDRYRLISEEIPRDIGIAYRAHDLQQDRLVDLFVVKPGLGSGEEALQRLQQVGKTVSRLSAPSLSPFEHAGLVNGQVYLVYAHTAGETLADLLKRHTRLDVETAVAIAIRLCEALAPAHQAGLTHGSLSPQCIVLKETADPGSPPVPEISVLDTGLLPALRPAEPASQMPWGRLPYISPEQAAGQGVHPPSDVYVIGTLLYEMLIGRPPFRATDETVLALQHLHQEPASLQIMDATISQSLAQIVYRTLAKEPSVRYRNASQLAHLLRAQVEQHPEPVRAMPREHLVVPPPFEPIPGATLTAAPYQTENSDAKREAQAGVDWVLIGLLVAALIAVLGLIPLWSAVYARYAGTPAGSPVVLRQHKAEPILILWDRRHMNSVPAGSAELGERPIVWYNAMRESSLAYLQTVSVQELGPISGEKPCLGVQLTGQEEEL